MSGILMCFRDVWSQALLITVAQHSLSPLPHCPTDPLTALGGELVRQGMSFHVGLD